MVLIEGATVQSIGFEDDVSVIVDAYLAECDGEPAVDRAFARFYWEQVLMQYVVLASVHRCHFPFCSFVDSGLIFLIHDKIFPRKKTV